MGKETNYTKRQEDKAYEFWGQGKELDDDYSQIIAFLNDSKSFLNFGGRLQKFISETQEIPEVQVTANYLLQKCSEKNLKFNRNTANKWLSNNLGDSSARQGPKKGDGGRELLYTIAFALELSLEDTTKLFHKVYLDRSFNYRNPKEFIYAYCFAKGLPKQQSEAILMRVPGLIKGGGEDTIFTKALAADVQMLESDDAIISYISEHPYNFKVGNRGAKEVRDKLLKKVHEVVKQERDKKRQELLDAPGKGNDYFKGKDEESIEFMLEMIIGQKLINDQKQSIFSSAVLPKEIKSRFPTAHTFSQKDPSFEELRKMIILLFSYDFWFEMQYQESFKSREYIPDIGDYTADLNSLLVDANLPELYYGNPYDWLFLYSTLEGDCPLDIFRSIMAEVLYWSITP